MTHKKKPKAEARKFFDSWYSDRKIPETIEAQVEFLKTQIDCNLDDAKTPQEKLDSLEKGYLDYLAKATEPKTVITNYRR